MQARHLATRVLAASALSALTGVWGVAAATAPAAASTSTRLVGTFEITAGACSGGKVSGTYIQMILPSGNASGPYMSNSDSTCSNQAVTPMSAGTDGGLITGEYQPAPSPPFDSHGDALAKRITTPAQYEGTSFATSTERVDPQTKTKVPAPTIIDTGGKLTGDVRAFGVTWNNQYFNQGSPKPNGTYPGSSKPVSGTYDASTGAYTLDWISGVVGGPFDKFSCHWHLTGKFVPAAGSTTGTSTGSHPGTTTSGSHSGTTTTSGNTSTTTSTGSTSTGSRGSATGSGSGPNIPTPATGTHGSAASAGDGVAPQLASNQAATTSTVSKQTWRVSWWLVAVALGIAVIGFAGLGIINRRIRLGAASGSAPSSGPVTS